jgi:ligand-binding sensor domain-containing protein
LVENVVEASFATATEPVEIETDGSVSNVSDMIILDSVLYAVYDGGLVSYDFRTKQTTFNNSSVKLNAVVRHNDQIIVGGDQLYTVSGNKLDPYIIQTEGTIQYLSSINSRLMVGTDLGLYVESINGMEQLMDDVSVTSIVSGFDGLWVGTDGQGLYYWDGDIFRKRYLLRDTSIFDIVHSLDYNHNHLYVGAATGFFVFNGGRWEQFTSVDGLPDDNVKSVDASSWVVYIGTENGIVSYFENNLTPVKKFETTSAAVVKSIGRKLIVGTDGNGVIMKAGSFVKTLVEPEIERKEEMFSKSEDETI